VSHFQSAAPPGCILFQPLPGKVITANWLVTTLLNERKIANALTVGEFVPICRLLFMNPAPPVRNDSTALYRISSSHTFTIPPIQTSKVKVCMQATPN
jgi:hypothetical protein